MLEKLFKVDWIKIIKYLRRECGLSLAKAKFATDYIRKQLPIEPKEELCECKEPSHSGIMLGGFTFEKYPSKHQVKELCRKCNLLIKPQPKVEVPKEMETKEFRVNDIECRDKINEILKYLKAKGEK